MEQSILNKHKVHRSILLLLIIFGFQFGYASTTGIMQNIQITGKVVDALNDPIIGATVAVKGTPNGTITDMDGNYSINVSGSKVTLAFSFIGLITKEVTVGNQTVINVTLIEDSQQLDEVVVVGYGVQKKSHLTGSVAKVNTDGLEDIPVSRVDQALQGKVAGLQIRNTTSEVGESPQIRVRGMGSISADSEPLVIVDGFPLEGGLGLVNMNDVESIEVLKDAASSAIYGSRAANGVIMVTTKSGSEQKTKYTFKTSYGIKNAYKLHPIMSAGEYVDFRIDELTKTGATKMPDEEFAYMVLDDMLGTTNWQEMPLRTAGIFNAQLGVQGGKKGLSYYISGAYTSDEGIMVNNSFDRINLRAKIDADLSKRIKIGVNIAPTYTKTDSPGSNFQDYYKTPSWMPAKHTAQTAAFTGMEEGTYTVGEDFNYKDYTGYDPIMGEERTVNTRPYGSTNPNPASRMENIYKDRTDYNLQTSVYLNVNLYKGLDFKTSNSAVISYRESNSYQNVGAATKGATNKGVYQNRLVSNLLSENLLTYTTKINKVHDISALLGYSAQLIKTKTAGIVGEDFPSDYIHTLNQAGTIKLVDGSTRVTGTWINEEAMMSVFSRINYSYADKYLLSASIRTDGSSKFGKDNQWGWFPSVSVGWRISEESFLKDNAEWLNQLKLRASYGVTGTDKIANYANTNMLDVTYYPLGTGNGTVTPGLINTSTAMGNTDLQWEQTNESNLGFDLSMFNSRINLSLDCYYAITKSLLFQRDIPSYSGFTKAWTNLGKVRNQGLEMELTTYNIKNKNFSWSSTVNFATNKNKVIDLGGPEELITTISSKKLMYIARVGEPVIQYYGYKTVGIWNTMEEINNNPHYATDTRPGGLRVQNTNGDGEINEKDMVALGSPFPDFTWGFSNTFKYKIVDLTFLIQGSQGGKIWNNDETINETRKWNKNYVTGRWISEEHTGDGKTPYYNYGIDHAITDYPIQDATYIALRDVTLGVTLPKNTIKKLGVNGVRFYASCQNLYYWWPSGYKGINPEAMTTSGDFSSPLTAGYQQGAFPLQRTFNFGIDINF